MVGGKVIETIVVGDRVWVNAAGTGSERGETCAVYVKRNSDSEAIEPGDHVWWQGDNLYWTPQDRRFRERAVTRVGYSGVGRPEGSDVLDQEIVCV